MYRCGLCSACVGPKVAMRRHIVKRRNGQIAQEIPVCEECGDDLLIGIRPSLIKEEFTRDRVVVAPPPLKRAPGKFVPSADAVSSTNGLVIPRPAKGGRK